MPPTCIGKWHLGDQPVFLPTRQGFDHYFGLPYSNDMQIASAKTKGKVVPLVRDEAVEELLTDGAQSQLVERYTNEAVEFMRARKDQPFFLYLPHTAVHTPIHPGAAFAGKSANGRYGDWVEEVDWSVGRVLETLKELKLEERTLVLFSSDNGPWLTKGADGGSAGPAPRREREHLGGRHARADDRVVARQDPAGHDLRHRGRYDRRSCRLS